MEKEKFLECFKSFLWERAYSSENRVHAYNILVNVEGREGGSQRERERGTLISVKNHVFAPAKERLDLLTNISIISYNKS